MRRNVLAVLVAVAVLVGTAAAQPKVMSLPELGIEPGSVGGTLTMSLGSAPPSIF